MNILILTHSYPDINNTWRGIFINDQAKALSLIHNVTVVYFKVDYSHFSPFSGYRYSVKETGTLTEYIVTTGRSFPVINQLKYLYGTYRFICEHILNKKKIDIIHSHLSYPAGFLGTIIQKIKEIPNVITEHSWVEKYFRSPVHRLCVVYALKNCSCIVAVSNSLKKNIGLFCKNPVRIIPNVVDADRFPLLEARNDSKFHLGLLGGLSTNRKGLDILLKSASLLNDRNLHLHIGGDGILLDHYKRRAMDLEVYDKCTFYGQILPDKQTEFYSKLDVFVLPSRDETFGVVVIEAMSCGLPVIATKCGGPQEIITPETGILVALENEHELADAILFMSSNLKSFDRATIKKYAGEKYGQKAFLSNVSMVYSETLDNLIHKEQQSEKG